MMKLVIFLLISLLLATGVEAAAMKKPPIEIPIGDSAGDFRGSLVAPKVSLLLATGVLTTPDDNTLKHALKEEIKGIIPGIIDGMIDKINGKIDGTLHGAPDPAFVDPAFVDPAFVDPAIVDPAFVDPAFVDPAFVDPAFVDSAFVKAEHPLSRPSIPCRQTRPSIPCQAEHPDKPLSEMECQKKCPSSPPYTFTSKDSLTEAVQAYDANPASAEEKYGPIAGWDVSAITDMSHLFYGLVYFNEWRISNWDTSRVTDMSYMFGVRSGWMFAYASSLSDTNKLLIRCAWADTSAFASAGYGESWAHLGSCTSG